MLEREATGLQSTNCDFCTIAKNHRAAIGPWTVTAWTFY